MAGVHKSDTQPIMFGLFVRSYILLLVVFITGAAVLVLEVAATRVLSPYFGNTIFTVSSVISVILFALSIGYAAGGRLADKRGTELLFYQIILLSGFSVLLLQLFKLFLLPGLSSMLSLREGPLVASLLLFFLPGVLLGILSPFVVKLQQARNNQGIGQTAGDVFFWSTLGSIVGSLATGFYLIPSFGITEIINGVALVLISIGMLGSILAKGATAADKKLVLTVSVVFVCLSLFVSLLKATAIKNTVFASDGIYDSITIYDSMLNDQPTRLLQQSTDASSAMYLESQELVFAYTKYHKLYQLIDPDIEKALVIGGGAYSVPKALLQDDNDVVVDVAEIEPELYNLGKKYFSVPDDSRLRNHVGDGRRVMSQSEEKYNLIFADAFHTTIPAHLTTKEFFVLSKQKLVINGLFVMNIIGSLNEEKPSFLFSEVKTFKSVYPNSYFFAVRDINAPHMQNIIMVGINGEQSISFTSKDQFLASLPSQLLEFDSKQLEPHTIFTDNYSPVEYFISTGLPQ